VGIRGVIALPDRAGLYCDITIVDVLLTEIEGFFQNGSGSTNG
jgi:hypothetical protein